METSADHVDSDWTVPGDAPPSTSSTKPQPAAAGAATASGMQDVVGSCAQRVGADELPAGAADRVRAHMASRKKGGKLSHKQKVRLDAMRAKAESTADKRSTRLGALAAKKARRDYWNKLYS
jgi:hypothetical protein